MKQKYCGGGAGNTFNGTWRGNREDASGGLLGIAATLSDGNSIDPVVIGSVDQPVAGALAAGTANPRELLSPMAPMAASLSTAPQAIRPLSGIR